MQKPGLFGPSWAGNGIKLLQQEPKDTDRKGPFIKKTTEKMNPPTCDPSPP